MDWENERYVRVYVRETVDDAVLSWEARALWDAMIKRFDRAGVIDTGDHGWKGVALLVRMPIDVVEKAGAELLRDGRVENRQGYLIAPNYIPAQEAKQSDRQRQSESRARKRDQVMALVLGVGEDKREMLLLPESVTNRDDLSQNVTETAECVTDGHTPSHYVTPSLAVPSCTKPSLKNNTLSVASGSDPLPVLEDGLRSETKPPTPSAKTRKPKPPPSDTATKAASYLRDRILETAPNCAASRLTPKQIEAWARTLDKLASLSPDHTWRAIRETVDWLHDAENTFVVQSPAALEKKWDAIQANRRKVPLLRNGAPKPEDPYERAARIREQQGAR
jgi:hypothetical protein